MTDGVEGKKAFYIKAKEALESAGYQYFDEHEIKGIGRSHMSKPDYIAVKKNVLVIGEIKSPAESPTSPSWRQIQKSDGEEFKRVRLEVANREREGKVSKEVGGHEIVIRGQIPDYVEKLGKTYLLPFSEHSNMKTILGYSFPTEETFNVEHAFKNCKSKILKVIDIGNGITTYFFK
ncbi:MAG TPA: hypothetical protein P5244_07520 [Syntrophales bacterium]|nr:hypothetical protein [Syntrophales bacterium]HRT27059.1 hypothetical protein [Syntrophales bacterium]HRT71079.1 hypothetical protein [Syntrophales bacterium]